MVVLDSMWTNMFAMGTNVPEKLLRTVLVYAGIVIVIRIFGKRLMAQMNSLDLVVVLLLSNVVQNAIIGDDNSVSGGLLGAVTLVVVNWLMDMAEHRFPKLRRLIEGSATTLIQHGRIDRTQLKKMGVTGHELSVALRHQGADEPAEVRHASLEPGGTILVDLERPQQAASYGELVQELQQLRDHIDARLDAITAEAQK